MLVSAAYYPPKSFETVKYYISFFRITGCQGQNRLGHSKNVFDSRERSCNQMSTNKSNHLVNPQAREAMDRFKMEAASQVGVNLTNGYNGELTSRQAGSIGGQMVKKMIEAYENGMK